MEEKSKAQRSSRVKTWSWHPVTYDLGHFDHLETDVNFNQAKPEMTRVTLEAMMKDVRRC